MQKVAKMLPKPLNDCERFRSAGSRLPGTQFGNVWIGGCFQEHQYRNR